jgi:hypothetical protein
MVFVSAALAFLGLSASQNGEADMAASVVT